MLLDKSLILFIVSLAGTFSKVSALFKLTNVKCESLNKTISEFHQCQLRTLKTGVSAFDMNLMLKYSLNDVQVNAQIYRKANQYRPFFFNYTADCCQFQIERKHSFLYMLANLYEEFSNINHTCPYVGEQIINGFYLRHSFLSIPLPSGEYLLSLRWMTGMVKIFVTNVYFTYAM